MHAVGDNILLSSKEELNNKEFKKRGNYFSSKTKPFQEFLLSFLIMIQAYDMAVLRVMKDCSPETRPVMNQGQKNSNLNPMFWVFFKYIFIYVCI